MSKKKIVIPVIGVLAVCGIGGWGYFRQISAEDTSIETQNYLTETVQTGSVSSGFSEDGTVSFGSNTQVFSVAEVSDSGSSDSSSSGSSGEGNSMSMGMSQGGSSSSQSSSSSSSSSDASLEVEEVYVSAGQVVEEGDPILKITEESIEEYREELTAAVTSAQLTVEKETINLETKQAEAEYTYNMYLAEGETAEETYQATITSLENEITDLEEELADAQEEALETFEAEIGDGVVYAEYSGSVTAVSVSAGDSLSNDLELVSYTDSDEVTMTVSVTQDDIANVTVGDTAVITLMPYDEEFDGEVLSIESASSMGGTVAYNVSVRFTGDTSKVYADMTGEVTFLEKSVSDVIYISNKAVYTEGTKSYVKVLLEDGTIEEREIETGFSNGSKVEVSSGLSDGDTIIIESQVTG